VFTRNTDAQARLRERLSRVAAANDVLAPYRLRLSDWQGTSYVLTGPTGKTAMVADLTGLWRAAEALLGGACDPLDPDLLDRIEAGHG
jgi:hypothetical protein